MKSVARFLIARGAIANIKDRTGNTPLDYAKYYSAYEEMRCILIDGAMEQLFIKAVVGGILCPPSSTPFRSFLADDGVCDARLLIHIAEAAYLKKERPSL